MFTASGGEGGNNQLISLAMGEASKLFDSSGGSSSGGKQDAINSAAMTMMKMVVMVGHIVEYYFHFTWLYVPSPNLAVVVTVVAAWALSSEW